MKRFYSKKNNRYLKIIIIIISVIFLNIVFFNTYGKTLGDNISYFTKLKIDEITKYYLNNTIKKYLNIKTNDYINVNLVNNSIVSVDIDNNNANVLLKNILDDLEDVVKNIEDGKINNYHNLEILKGSDGIVTFMPIGVVFNNSLFSSLGPKIPVKVSFLEDINAYVDVEVKNYGINNSLVNLYINISIDEVFEMPIKKSKSTLEYKFLISSKIINGEVPSILGEKIKSSSSIVNNNVKV